MTDPCRVSIDELHHDLEEIEWSELHEEYQREAEIMIGNLDEIEPILNGIKHAEEDDDVIELLKSIRSRDIHKIGELILQMLKNELVSKLED